MNVMLCNHQAHNVIINNILTTYVPLYWYNLCHLLNLSVVLMLRLISVSFKTVSL